MHARWFKCSITFTSKLLSFITKVYCLQALEDRILQLDRKFEKLCGLVDSVRTFCDSSCQEAKLDYIRQLLFDLKQDLTASDVQLKSFSSDWAETAEELKSLCNWCDDFKQLLGAIESNTTLTAEEKLRQLEVCLPNIFITLLPLVIYDLLSFYKSFYCLLAVQFLFICLVWIYALLGFSIINVMWLVVQAVCKAGKQPHCICLVRENCLWDMSL